MHITQTREQVILLTLRLASEKGLASVSLSDIAKAAHITKASLQPFQQQGGDHRWNVPIDGYVQRKRHDRSFRICGRSAPENSAALGGGVYHRPDALGLPNRVPDALYRPTGRKEGQSDPQHVPGTDPSRTGTLSDTGRLDIPDLDLATTLFSCAAASFVDEENITEKDEDDWALSRMVQQFCRVFAPR